MGAKRLAALQTTALAFFEASPAVVYAKPAPQMRLRPFLSRLILKPFIKLR
jgi:hypothetical protein